jgi:U3 small nucleolar RNA-associated protein 10
MHLVRSLGAADFLPPIAMLLVDRGTTKSGKGATVTQAIELALGVAAGFDVAVRLQVRGGFLYLKSLSDSWTQALKQVVAEVGRLFGDLSKEEKDALLSLL